MTEPMLRILHVGEFLQGGIASYLDELLPAQVAQLGAGQVAVVCPEDHVAYLEHQAGYEIRPYRREGRDPGSLWRLAVGFRQALRDFRPTVVHLHSTFAGAMCRPILAAVPRRRRPGVVYCAHGWGFLREARSASLRANERAERLLGRWTDALVSISETEHRAALAHHLPAGRCQVVRHGISDAAVCDPDLTAVPGAAGAPIRLLFVGRHDPQKGLDLLLDAMALLEPASAQLTVAGDAALRPERSTKMAAAGVTWLGWVPHHELDGLLRTHDALVVPSRWEGFGLVALEAMRAGRAVVASDRGSLPEIVEDGRTGVVVSPLTPERLATALRTLTRPELESMGVAGRQRFEDEFTAERMNRQTLDVYRSVATRS